MMEAKKYSKNYWDGDRRFGYGGYKYIPGRWKPVAEALIQTYSLNNKSKILDVGCGKGYLLYEIKLLLPDINLTGIEFSNYGIENSKPEIKPYKQIIDLFNINASTSAMFDDIAKNLVPAKKVNFTSVWIDAGYENFSDDIEASKQYLDYQTRDLSLFIKNVNEGKI